MAEETKTTKTVPVPAPGRNVMYRDKKGTWPATVRAVNPEDPKQVDLVVFTALSGAYAGKQALGVSYDEDKEYCWWWPERTTATMEV